MTSAFRQTTASRGIPAMRPSYDAEHPHSATPIYDELYSEYRRLFRALPGDRAGEEDLRFTGFAVRERRPYALEEYRAPYGQSQSQNQSQGPQEQHQPFPSPFPGYSAGYGSAAPQFVPAQQALPHQPQQPHHQPHHPSQQHHHQHQHQQHSPQPSAGQGWVASGYLAATAPAVPAPAAPAPVGAGMAGRHRSGLLSLPPGRSHS
ncbi:hypothetical protein [Kitasatospora sp. MAP12-44]|uniref:hypothetical protein n=2 Tax=Kitasatospora TaxID=2063 RepID=UPI0024743F38|nr:hypothetical protein [Kitasatospora sp. MAP12-44]